MLAAESELSRLESTLDLGDTPDTVELYCPHIPSQKQLDFLSCWDRMAFYGGRQGCGKSDVLIMAALQGIIHDTYSALLLRRTYRDLCRSGALLDRMRSWFDKSPARWCAKDWWFQFPTGARISVGYCDHENDLERYQSAEYNFIGLDEAGQFTPGQVLSFFGRIRRCKGTDFPSRLRGTLNPGGELHDFICTLFNIKTTDTFPAGSPPRHAKDANGDRCTFFPAHPEDNPGLDWDDYDKSLNLLPGIKRLQRRDGLWIKDEESLVYKGLSKARRAPALPKGDWHYGLVVDIGASNTTAFAIGAYCDWHPTAFLVSVDEPEGMNTAADIAREIARRNETYQFEFLGADPGGLGVGYIEEFRKYFSLPVVPVPKNDKPGHIELFNDALTEGRIQLIEGQCKTFEEQASKLTWKNDKHLEEMPGKRNHSCDASMYLHRMLEHYHTTAPEPIERDEAEKIEEAILERHQRENSDYFGLFDVASADFGL